MHPSDEKKKDDVSRYWPDWYKIKWVDKETSCFDYDRPVLTRPNKTPNEKTHCQFSDTIDFNNDHKLLVGPFEFAPKSNRRAADQFMDSIH